MDTKTCHLLIIQVLALGIKLSNGVIYPIQDYFTKKLNPECQLLDGGGYTINMDVEILRT